MRHTLSPSQRALLARVLARAERKIKSTPGGAERLAEYLTKATEKPVSRQQVGKWFRADASKRHEPGLAIGLLILRWAEGKPIIKEKKPR